MRILSYNIHKGIGNDRRYRIQRVIEVIRAEAPDIVCLQEVDRGVARSRYDDQPRVLASALGFPHALYQLNVRLRRGGYGNLILTRFPIRESHQISLRLRTKKPRGAQLATLDADGRPLHLVHWHLGLARFLLALATRPNPPPALSPGLEGLILRHPWPGNVRELKSALEVALVLAEGAPALELDHLPPDLLQVEAPPTALGALSDDALDVVQANAIRRALDACAGNVSAAARRLGVARSTIYRALQRRGE